ncbi:uncharacterized protein BDZ99DRAFT_513741 [Mytilinidion resinicola]|uniref:Uncharacterized protein n=1 Tax=Mytilinidion resinicola TaxID=574789 RepID=A0A6A6Z9L3_9PEZI|nr:uncharacterized protein BDZ99DRAFT_513741 [Mytilinidion resinicola]KAF2817498.1 hypothetical protein BDZ99DRAFT_513741 [Mytilinidion resinicola]
MASPIVSKQAETGSVKFPHTLQRRLALKDFSFNETQALVVVAVVTFSVLIIVSCFGCFLLWRRRCIQRCCHSIDDSQRIESIELGISLQRLYDVIRANSILQRSRVSLPEPAAAGTHTIRTAAQRPTSTQPEPWHAWNAYRSMTSSQPLNTVPEASSAEFDLFSLDIADARVV